MPYVTHRTFKVINNAQNDNKAFQDNEPIYDKHIDFFNKKEIEWLKQYRNTIKTIQDELKSELFQNEYNQKQDTGKLLFLSKNNLIYHKTRECSSLFNDYINYEIPDVVIEKWEEEKQKFRDFFNNQENKKLLEAKNVGKLYMRMAAKFQYIHVKIIVSLIKNFIHKNNSGLADLQLDEPKEEQDIIEIQKEIDELLEREKKIFKIDSKIIPDSYKIFVKYNRKRLFLLKYFDEKGELKQDMTIDKKDEEILNWNSNQVKLLFRYKEEYTDKCKKLLRIYYQLQYNPNLEISDSLAKRMKIFPCKKCYGKWVF